jgi:hypothetical protein
MRLATYFCLGLLLALLIAQCMGCATHPTKEQSWDQENLKAHDSGCPTAIFTAPGGNLTQC